MSNSTGYCFLHDLVPPLRCTTQQRIENLEVELSELQTKAAELCSVVENKDDLPLNKWALKCGYLVNQVKNLLPKD